jgi:uncharacterized metal-binding protein
MTKPKLRKKAEINPAQSPHDGIHTCSKGCSKPGCTRTLRDTIEEQNKQIEALKQDLLEQAAAVRQLRFERIHDISHMGGQDEEIARLQDMCEKHAQEARTLYDFMSRFDWIIYAHYCKGGASETHNKLVALRIEYLEWKNPGEERGL